MPLARLAVRCDQRQVRSESVGGSCLLSDRAACGRNLRRFGLTVASNFKHSNRLGAIRGIFRRATAQSLFFLSRFPPNPHILFRFSLGPVYSADSTDSNNRWRFRLLIDTTGFLAPTRTTIIGTPFS